MMNIAKAVPRKRDEIYSILVTVISQLLEDVYFKMNIINLLAI